MKKSFECVKYFVEHVPVDIINLVNQGGRMLYNENSDLEVSDFIFANDLLDAEKSIRFMVQAKIEQINSHCDMYESIKGDFRNEWKAKLESAGLKVEYALDNPRIHDEELSHAMNEVIDCIKIFRNNIFQQIQEIRRIDTQSEREFLFKSIWNLRSCKFAITDAIASIKQLLNAYELMFVIGEETQDNMLFGIRSFNQDMRDIVVGDTCLLMAKYCKEQEKKEFWYGLPNRIEETKKFLCSDGYSMFGNKEQTENETSQTSFWDTVEESYEDIFEWEA